MTHVTCRLTDKTGISSGTLRSVIEYWLPFFTYTSLLRSGNQTPDLIPDAPPIRERESAEVITINNTIYLFLKLQSAFQSFQTITVFIIIIIIIIIITHTQTGACR